MKNRKQIYEFNFNAILFSQLGNQIGDSLYSRLHHCFVHNYSNSVSPYVRYPLFEALENQRK